MVEFISEYTCPLDGSILSFSYGEGNDAYKCANCGTVYPTLSKKEADILKDIESHALSRLGIYKQRLSTIKEEEGEIKKIFEFTEKNGLLSRLNKANLSAKGQETK
jgi:hypothetical protein